MDKRRFLLLLALSLLLLARCSHDNIWDNKPDVPAQNGDIAFEIGFASQTRVSTGADFTSAWEEGDEIGIFAVAHGEKLAKSGNFIHNVKLTFKSGTWVLATPLYWPTTSSGITALDFYAYFPYDASRSDPTAIAFKVLTDQSDSTTLNSTSKSNYNLSDLLTAKSDNTGNGYDKTAMVVPLTFSHALVMVQVSVPYLGKGFGPGEDLKVKLRGIKPGANVNLNDLDASTPGSEISLPKANNNAVNITMCRVEQYGDDNYEKSFTYRALVPAQEIKEGNNLFEFDHEAWRILTDKELSSAFTMTAGQAETFERILPAKLLHTAFIPAGTFMMGSSDGSNYQKGIPDIDLNATIEEPERVNEMQHWVKLTKNFQMSKYEITNAQYAAFLNDMTIGSNGEGSVTYFDRNGIEKIEILKYITESSGYSFNWGLNWDVIKNAWVPVMGYEDHPVIYVSWYGAKAYADWVGGRLPTEAQWEYACRGGKSNMTYGIGNGKKLTYKLANFEGTEPYDVDKGGQYTSSDPEECGYLGYTTIVGTYPYPNGYGLYDMHGNVMEWCGDRYELNYGDIKPTDTIIDPTGPSTTTSYTLTMRGGGWGNGPQMCRSAIRFSRLPDDTLEYIGFRVVFIP